MGKITEALKKAQSEREVIRKRLEEKRKALKPSAQISSAPKKEVKQRKPSLEERLKDLVYIAKSNKAGLDPRIVTYSDPQAPISEQYRILRTNIIHSDGFAKTPKVIVISSSFHGEGKSITAVNLAITMAQNFEKRILLVDCDLRGGIIHQLLTIDTNAGLSDILNDKIELDSCLHKTDIASLSVLPRGDIPSNPSELLGSKRMRRLLEELKAKFDYIILDSPPIIPLTDAGLLGTIADGVIFVIQAYRTQRRNVEQALIRFKQSRSRMLGFVLTGVEHFIPGYMYSYYRYYYRYRNREREKKDE